MCHWNLQFLCFQHMKSYAMLNNLKTFGHGHLHLTPKTDGLVFFTFVSLTQLHESKLFSGNLGSRYHSDKNHR